MRELIVRFAAGVRKGEELRFEATRYRKLSVGRAHESDISFDAEKDDLVSRTHAAIEITADPSHEITLSDLASSNGTFLNGKRVSAKTKLSHGDRISFGGPSSELIVTFDPAPAPEIKGTRLADAVTPRPMEPHATVQRAAAATRSESTSADDRSFSGFAGNAALKPQPSAPIASAEKRAAEKVGVGRETMMQVVQASQRGTNRAIMALFAGMVAVIAVVGAAFWQHSRNLATPAATSPVASTPAIDPTDASAVPVTQVDAKAVLADAKRYTPADIAASFGEASVYIKAFWSLYFVPTGQQVFHRYVETKTGQRLPAFVLMNDKGLEPWLSLDNALGLNRAVGEGGQGSGFVVSEDGFVLTNKHVAAGWKIPGLVSFDLERGAIIYPEGCQSPDRCKGQILPPPQSAQLAKLLAAWIPSKARMISMGSLGATNAIEKQMHIQERLFDGRIDRLEVQFPHQNNPIAARLLRVSDKADVALIKLDLAAKSKKVALRDVTNEIRQGEQIVVLGYPGVSPDQAALISSVEASRAGEFELKVLPDPTLSVGYIGKVIPSNTQVSDQNVRVINPFADTYQLTVNSTGHGNSGGPVFNESGEVIGLFTYGFYAPGDAAISFAVPIKYGIELLGGSSEAQQN